MRLWTAMLGAWLASGPGLAAGPANASVQTEGERLRTPPSIAHSVATPAAEEPAPLPEALAPTNPEVRPRG